MLKYISQLSKADQLRSEKRKLVVLGSTGSIGQNVLRVAGENPDRFELLGLAAGENIDLLAEQAAFWRPHLLGIKREELLPLLQEKLPQDYKPEILVDDSGYTQMASLREADMVVSAQVGAAGLPPTFAALRAGKVVALANKESLVLAGPLLRRVCSSCGGEILPVDSEHNALFQALLGHNSLEATNLLLTASGGPFFGKDKAFLDNVSPKQALAHPNWSMGAKISIDSATLMNKGLEVIEAHYLFGVSQDRIQVLIHPESIVHSLVEYQDGSILAHMGIPDMRIPIAFCMSYPRRLKLDLEPLDLVNLVNLSFYEPDNRLFPCLELAREALQSGESYPVVLNAANEEAVKFFLQEIISFQDIAWLNRECMARHKCRNIESLEDIWVVDEQSRDWVRGKVAKER